MLVNKKYPLASKYTNYHKIYEECSGPGGLEIAEAIVSKLNINKNSKILDIGTAHGYQTCFVAKEFNLTVVGIDPMPSFRDELLQIDHLEMNAVEWGVQDKVVGIQVGVPDTKLPTSSFDAIYSITALEMLRGFYGNEFYLNSLKEIYRLLKPGCLFGLAEPMHNDVPIPPELLPIISQSKDCIPWKDAFDSLANTQAIIEKAGFKIVDCSYFEESFYWWNQYITYDPHCINNPDHEDIKAITIDNDRWVSIGYIIAEKI